jgi:hypothetical protein
MLEKTINCMVLKIVSLYFVKRADNKLRYKKPSLKEMYEDSPMDILSTDMYSP